MIVVQLYRGHIFAFNPKFVMRVWEEVFHDSDTQAVTDRYTCLRFDDRTEAMRVDSQFMDVIKAIDEHNKTGKSVSLVEGITL